MEIKLARRGDRPVEPALTPDGAPLGVMLVAERTVAPSTVKAALKQQRRDGRRLGQILIEHHVPSRVLTAALERKLGVVALDLDALRADPDALACVPSALARELTVFPHSIDDEGALHAAAFTIDDALARRLEQTAGRPVRLEFADADSIQRAIDMHHGLRDKVGAAAERAVQDDLPKVPMQELALLSPDAPVVQIVDLLLTQGLRDRASDIHIEPQRERVRIRYRVDGALRDVQSLPAQLGPALASRLKIMADMDIVDRHRAQDGQTSISVDGRTVDIRIATMETVWGEKVVLRLLDRSRSLMPLAQLGLRAEEHALLQRLIASPYGLFIVSGPTGSGKTTTLYAALNEKDRMTENVTTIEDPVEYEFDGINQVQINRLAGMTFANGLRAILRQDPDVILVGEVRDVETAQIAVQSALTGHLVMASLHAADAVGALFRFLDMGLEGYLIASSVIGVVAQRLVRLNCTKCLTKVVLKPEEAEFYRFVRGRTPPRHQLAGSGCTHCDNAGFYERTGVFECTAVTDATRAMIVGGATQDQIREHARAQGMRTLQDAVCDLVDAGKTTIAEAMRTVYVL